MTRPIRLTIGVALILAIGCAAAQRTAEKIPAADRVLIEAAVVQAACREYASQPRRSPDVDAVCALFMAEPDDAPHSGDSGPPYTGPADDGGGVRSVR